MKTLNTYPYGSRTRQPTLGINGNNAKTRHSALTRKRPEFDTLGSYGTPSNKGKQMPKFYPNDPHRRKTVLPELAFKLARKIPGNSHISDEDLMNSVTINYHQDEKILYEEKRKWLEENPTYQSFNQSN